MEETVKLELSWEEYTLLISAIKFINGSLDDEELNALYTKMYMERKIERV